MGTLIEAAAHDAPLAVLIVHQFAPHPEGSIPTRDRRNWPAKLAANDKALTTFIIVTTDGEAMSHTTEFVPGGIELEVHKALAPLELPEGSEPAVSHEPGMTMGHWVIALYSGPGRSRAADWK